LLDLFRCKAVSFREPFIEFFEDIVLNSGHSVVPICAANAAVYASRISENRESIYAPDT
jgi:hypothetical protein